MTHLRWPCDRGGGGGGGKKRLPTVEAHAVDSMEGKMSVRGVIAEAGSGRDEVRDQPSAGLPVTECTMELAGIPTAVLEGGSGPPLVLL